MKLNDIEPTVNITSVTGGGICYETDSGALIRHTAADGTARIYRSTDDGATWSLRQSMTIAVGFTGVKGWFIDSRGYCYCGGYTQTTYEAYTRFAELWQSKDDGLTWTKVCTAETSSFWHFAEDSTGRVYVNEYSLTPSTGTEYPALNIWRSDTSGDNFTKWHTAAGETLPGAKDGVRHIHTVYVDSSDRVFVAYGDQTWTGYATHVVRLDASGAIDIDYGAFPNGITAFIENDDGVILMGDDRDNKGISAINPTVALNCNNVSFYGTFGQRFNSYIYDLYRGWDGVIYGLAFPPATTKYPFIAYSTDEGRTWGVLYFGHGVYVSPSVMTVNPTAPHKRIYFSGNTIRWIKDYSKAELDSMRSGTVII